MTTEELSEPVLVAEPREGVPTVIDTIEAFESYCRNISSLSGPIAADAERASTYRYSHRNYLIQLKRLGSPIALIDPIAIEEAGGRIADLQDALGDCEWIFHDCRQDIPGFAELGLVPHRVFDTALAGQMLGVPHFNLSACTEYFLHKTLAKEFSAVDWSRRPIPRDWRNYAALDVELLHELRESMLSALQRVGKYEFFTEECEAVLEQALAPTPEKLEPWRHISHITELGNDSRGLAVARELWTVRDTAAQQYDIAPNLLLADASIIEAAVKKPHNTRQFKAIRSLHERVRIYMGDANKDEIRKMFEHYAPIQRKIRPNMWKNAIIRALDLPFADCPMGTKSRRDENDSSWLPIAMQHIVVANVVSHDDCEEEMSAPEPSNAQSDHIMPLSLSLSIDNPDSSSADFLTRLGIRLLSKEHLTRAENEGHRFSRYFGIVNSPIMDMTNIELGDTPTGNCLAQYPKPEGGYADIVADFLHNVELPFAVQWHSVDILHNFAVSPAEYATLLEFAEVNAVKSMKIWKSNHQDRYESLQLLRGCINALSQELAILPSVLLSAKIVKNLCWHSLTTVEDIAMFLFAQGARDWQIATVLPIVSAVLLRKTIH